MLDSGVARGAYRSGHHDAVIRSFHMDALLPVHITAGALGLLSGYVALYSTKGASLHRRSGMVFVYVMFTMAITGMIITIARQSAPAVNLPAALLTAYLVITALTTVRPLARGGYGLHVGGMILVCAVGVMSLKFGVEAIANGGKRNGIPAFPFFMFGIVGVLASVGDARLLKSGALRGALRLTRHLWRMCFALFIAALSFFIGQADVIPKPIRIQPLLALPILAVLLTMIYWMWRVRFKRSLRGIVTVARPDIA
jgi:uncharacterized membrane protein